MKRSLFVTLSVAILTVIMAMGFIACGEATLEIVDPRLTAGVPVWERETAPPGSHNDVSLATGAIYYLAPWGDDITGEGTFIRPWFTISRAQQEVVPGDTVYLRGGVYYYYYEDTQRSGIRFGPDVTTTGRGIYPNPPVNATWNYGSPAIALTVSGEEGKPITYATYPPDMPNNRAILDFTYVTTRRTTSGSSPSGVGISFGSRNNGKPNATTGNNSDPSIDDPEDYTSTDWIHLYGFDMRGMPGNSAGQPAIIFYYGSNNTLEFLRIHDWGGFGIWMVANMPCQNNLIKNVDIFNLRGTSQGGANSMDGICLRVGYGSTNNVLYGSRIWYVPDDGLDMIQAREQVIVDNTWIFWVGYYLTEEKFGPVNNFGTLSNPTVDNAKKFADPTWGHRLDYALVRDARGDGGGGGFKNGGQDMLGATSHRTNNNVFPNQVIRYSIAVGNGHSGFNNNHGIDGPHWFNNTAYRNSNNNYMFRSRLDHTDQGRYVNVNAKDVILKNNISYNLGVQKYSGLPSVPSRGSGAVGWSPVPVEVEWLDINSGIIENNSWEVVDNGAGETRGWVNRAANTYDVEESPINHTFLDIIQNARGLRDIDFVSFDENDLVKPRKPDGSLPDINFMRPVLGGRAEGIGHTASDNNDDGYGDMWKQVGARPWGL